MSSTEVAEEESTNGGVEASRTPQLKMMISFTGLSLTVW